MKIAKVYKDVLATIDPSYQYGLQRGLFDTMVQALADTFAVDNPKFDRVKFNNAVYKD